MAPQLTVGRFLLDLLPCCVPCALCRVPCAGHYVQRAAYWAFNVVANFAYTRHALIGGEVQARVVATEKDLMAKVAVADAEAVVCGGQQQPSCRHRARARLWPPVVFLTPGPVWPPQPPQSARLGACARVCACVRACAVSCSRPCTCIWHCARTHARTRRLSVSSTAARLQSRTSTTSRSRWPTPSSTSGFASGPSSLSSTATASSFPPLRRLPPLGLKTSRRARTRRHRATEMTGVSSMLGWVGFGLLLCPLPSIEPPVGGSTGGTLPQRLPQRCLERCATVFRAVFPTVFACDATCWWLCGNWCVPASCSARVLLVVCSWSDWLHASFYVRRYERIVQDTGDQYLLPA